ncbi:MAG: RNA polymerase sigma factor [Gammaproteobacteria bacterium]|nr:RNA polymerase sigma factor [Gammaproteobacteria bacterium]
MIRTPRPAPPPVDAALLSRARRGDRQAHAELYRAFAPSVYTLARRMLASASLAEDVLQETFVEVLRKIGGYRGDADVAFWIKRIAINKCLMHLRSGWSARRSPMPDVETLAAPARADGVDRQIALDAALAQLSDTARVVVWLHDVEGYTHGEIARLMHRTASFSKSQLARAHEHLRSLLHEATDETVTSTCVHVRKTC